MFYGGSLSVEDCNWSSNLVTACHEQPLLVCMLYTLPAFHLQRGWALSRLLLLN